MFRVWTKNLARVGKSEAHVHVYCLALTCSDAAEQLGKPFLLKGNFIFFSFNYYSKLLQIGLLTVRSE